MDWRADHPGRCECLRRQVATTHLSVGAGGDPARKGAMYTRSISALSTQHDGDVCVEGTGLGCASTTPRSRLRVLVCSVVGCRARVGGALNLFELLKRCVQ